MPPPLIPQPAITPHRTDIRAFASQQLALLAAELAAETSSTSSALASHAPSTLGRAGLAILNLTLSGQRTGLGGKTVLELGADPATHAAADSGIGEHGIRVGDVVRVGPQPRGAERKREARALEERGASGVVTKVWTEVIHVALDREAEEAEGGAGGEGLGGGVRIWV